MSLRKYPILIQFSIGKDGFDLSKENYFHKYNPCYNYILYLYKTSSTAHGLQARNSHIYLDTVQQLTREYNS